ncbi:MAG: hypothetical protein J6X49_06430 [Victivallales bacterium]|nr:hypothetical protein [Victivallales bacterium]
MIFIAKWKAASDMGWWGCYRHCWDTMINFGNRRKPWHCRPAPMPETAEAYYRSLCVQGGKVDIVIARIRYGG